MIDPQVDASAQSKAETEIRRGISQLAREYDFIVCGAGSSGSAVARRLAEDPTASVLLIDAGGNDMVEEVTNPLLWPANIGSARDWGFIAEANANLANRRLLMTMGRVLGGGSSVNVMVWARGHRSDWTIFPGKRRTTWSHESVSRIFRQIENWRGKSDPQYRGTDGPVWVQPPVDPSPLALRTLEAAGTLGIERFESQNGQMMEGDGGAALTDMLIRDNKRHSVFHAYIRPWLAHLNLTVLCNSKVQRLILEGKAARGVEVKINDEAVVLRARSEVVVSLGAINTPKLLMLSGIGDKKELKRHDLPVVQHLPGVGKNLQDHLTFPCVWSFEKQLPPRNNGSEVTIYWKSETDCAAPDMFLCQVEFPYRSEQMRAKGLPDFGWSTVGSLARPKSRGEIRLRSSNPDDMPILDMQFLSHRDDMETVLRGIKFCRELGNSSAFTPFLTAESLPGDLNDRELRQYIRDVGDTMHHQSCSAKMGTDAMSVVDGQLRVYGIERLRIADASVMPHVTIGNTMAPSVAIGELAASFIKLHGKDELPRLCGPDLKGTEMAASTTNTAVRSLSDLPSPRGLPLLGNALQFDVPRLHLVLEGWAEEFGSAFTIGLGPKRIFICSDADLLQTALRERPERYRRFSPIESVFAEMKGNGVFSAEGEKWRPQRRLVMQALASKHFSSFFPILRDITERLRRKWEHSAKAGQVVDMTKELVRFTVDVTTALAFGEDPNTIEESGNVIQEHLAAIFPMIMKRINANRCPCGDTSNYQVIGNLSAPSKPCIITLNP
jgi:choline dehydrogenase